jgi:hypothetical protein
MANEQAFLLALAVSVLLSALVIAIKRRSLHGILAESCGSVKQAGFWTNFTAIVLFLVPTLGVMMARVEAKNADPLFFQVVDQAKWGLLGLICALLIVGFFVAAVAQTRRGHVGPDQNDGMERLLGKVEKIRASHTRLRMDREQSAV